MRQALGFLQQAFLQALSAVDHTVDHEGGHVEGRELELVEVTNLKPMAMG